MAFFSRHSDGYPYDSFQPGGHPWRSDGAAGSGRGSNARRFFGIDNGGGHTSTSIIIWISVIVAIAQWFIPAISQQLAFAPFLGMVQPWRFVTSALLHAGFWHIFFNMYALWLIAKGLEPILGKWRFMLLYVLAAVGGNVGVVLLSSPRLASWYGGTVGASGAVFGLFGALLVIFHSVKSDSTIPLLILIGINLVMGFMPGSGISWQSHVGGLVTGIVAAWLVLQFRRIGRRKRMLSSAHAVARDPRRREPNYVVRDLIAYAVVAVLLVVVAAWRYGVI
ncbi:MAG: rhomboid family intramembrane serine protease [Actinomycetaceae bacterium]|nr:rhomboid family intramembrane serine protease [Actinomycetaceae bacterium]MDY6082414.1 rhomboid family intramembrane serine protease [Actinomycetaceae bacterium]